jgi:hypothetical protein
MSSIVSLVCMALAFVIEAIPKCIPFIFPRSEVIWQQGETRAGEKIFSW